MKTIFIVGASSQDGKILINKLEGKYKLFCFYRNYYLMDKSLKKNKFSLNNHKLISYLINKFKPYQIYYLSSHNKPFIHQENHAIDFMKNIHINLIRTLFPHYCFYAYSYDHLCQSFKQTGGDSFFF